MKKSCVVIFHIAFEKLGTFEDPIRESGFNIKYVDAAINNNLIQYKDADLVIILGGPVSVNDRQHYNFLNQEIELAKYRIAKDLPTIGICLGSQVLAHAAEAKIFKGQNGKEIGWGYMQFGQSLIPMFHWHGDSFDLPTNAKLLGSTKSYKNQAFSLGNNIIAFQCHPEFDYQTIEQWLVGHACELSMIKEIDIEKIRQDSKKYGEMLKSFSVGFIKKWIGDLKWKI